MQTISQLQRDFAVLQNYPIISSKQKINLERVQKVL